MVNSKKLSILALSLLVIGLVGSIFTFALTDKPEWITEEIELKDNNFTNIDISIQNGKVELIPSNEASTLIEVSGRKGKYKIVAENKGSTLSVALNDAKRKLFNFNFSLKSPTLKVYVPKNQYNSVRLTSSNGRMSIEKINANEFFAKTNNGTVLLNEISAKTINAKTDNGTITADQLTGTTIDVTSNNGRIALNKIVADMISINADNGRIQLEDIEGELSGKSKNGRITLSTSKLNHPIYFKTNNGTITINTDHMPVNATIQTKVSNGSSTIFGEKNKHQVYGSGENLINLSTNNGKIVVQKR